MKTLLFLFLSHARTHKTTHLKSARSLDLGCKHISRNCLCEYLCVNSYVCVSVGELFIYQVLSNVRVLSAAG